MKQRQVVRPEDGNWSVWHRPTIKMALAMKYYGPEDWMNRCFIKMVEDKEPGEIQLRNHEEKVVQRVF